MYGAILGDFIGSPCIICKTGRSKEGRLSCIECDSTADTVSN